MRKSLAILSSVAALVAAAGLASTFLCAQTSPAVVEADPIRPYIELLRSDFNSSKITTLNEVMKLTAPEAERFWPIYRGYEKELAAVGDRKLAMIREFASLHSTQALTEPRANDLATRWLKNKQEQLDLWKKYHRQISKALSPIRAAQFLQVEHQLSLFVDVTIASEMPVVGHAPASAK